MRSIRCITPPTALLCALLAGCGGGGGGGSGSSSGGNTPPVNTTPPTATISAVAPAQRVTQQPVTFTGTGTTVTTGALTYSWNFGDGATATGATASHSYATHGTFTVTLTVRDAGGLTTTATQSISLVAPPSAPVVTVDDASVTPNTVVNFIAAATDPQGGALTYEWTFDDGVTATGATVSHAYTSAGNFQVRVTATNAVGLATTSASSAVAVAWLVNARPNLTLLNDQHLLGHTLFAMAPFIETNGLPYTLTYSFGDSSTTTSTDATRKVHHTYAAAGDYPVTVTATSSAGQVTSFTRTASVRTPVAPASVSNNTLQPFCAGPFCGAANAATYSGSGLGVWRYHNPTTTDATINVSIGGLREGLAATLVISNGRKLPTSLPSTGSKIATAGGAPPTHEAMVEANQQFARSLSRTATPPAAGAAKIVQAIAPPVGATRTWREMPYSGQTYNMRVAATCTFSTGRNGVIWLDADQVQSGAVPLSRAEELATALCGPDGAYEKLLALTGQDLWGPAAAASPHLIQDTPAMQDLNIIVPGVPISMPFGGYFAAFNMNTTAFDPTSNAALSVIINGGALAASPNATAASNTLIHEIKHLANFYQRALGRSAYHSSWLEETSAILAEDLIAPLVTRESRTAARVFGYAVSPAGIDYIGWTHPQGQSYNLAGSFAGWLHRRYGTALDVELTTSCADGGSPESSYDCVDQFIASHGGVGFEDEFARMGASTLGGSSGNKLPSGFGYPGMMLAGAPLDPIGLFSNESPFNPVPLPVTPIFGRTMQTFLRDYIDAGQTTFTRTGVVVPAGTTLLVVVSEPPTFQ